MEKNKFIMLVWLPGSGKSTYAKELEEKELAEILSSDKIREELYWKEEIQWEICEVFWLMEKRCKDFLYEWKSVIYDATNLLQSDRKLVKNLGELDIKKEAIVIARPYEDCLKMNKNRERKVPEDIIKYMLLNFQMPYYFEWFDEIKIYYPNEEDKWKYWVYSDLPKKLMDFDQQNSWHPETLGQHLLEVHDRLKQTTDDKVMLETALVHDCWKPFTKRKKSDNSWDYWYWHHANVWAYMSLFYEWLSDKIKTAAITTYHNDTIQRQYKPETAEEFREIVWDKFYNEMKIFWDADHPEEIRWKSESPYLKK